MVETDFEFRPPRKILDQLAHEACKPDQCKRVCITRRGLQYKCLVGGRQLRKGLRG